MMTMVDEATVRANGAYQVGVRDATLQFVPVAPSVDLFWVRRIEYVPRAAPEAPRLARQLQKWTQWPTRVMAEALRTTHPTVQSLLDGRSPATSARSSSLRYRLRRVHEVVERVYELSGHDPESTNALLRTPSDSGVAPFVLLRAGEYAAAYLAVIDSFSSSSPTGLVVGRRPSTPGTSNRALAEE
jgi:hypothetical protein